MTSKGTYVTSLVSGPGRCFRIAPVRYCEYFNQGEQCKFCNYNSTYDDARAIGHTPPKTIDLEDTVEAYKIISSNVRLVEGRFQSGAFKNSEQEANIHFRFAEKIATAASYRPNLCINTPPMDRTGIQRLKDPGLSSISFNLEVWGEEMFEAVCPGKARTRGFGRYLEANQEAVDIFGFGGVSCNFIAGLSMIPENGHKTWQEARDSHIEGTRWLIKNGVMPVFTNLRLPPGSVYAEDKSNRDKLPPTDYLMDVALAHHNDMMEFGLYEKLNKSLYCALCCTDGLYAGELNMLGLAGDVGSWMDSIIPKEGNWIAKFLESATAIS
ncbi:MAG: hypothetical protein Q7O66_17070 [Dehalococcoidia bacterium]|nr:hypothetical protein [Dehalococcoidia bacterium]